MAMSTQRLIIMFLAFNLLIGTVVYAWDSSKTELAPLRNMNSQLSDFLNENNDPEPLAQDTDTQMQAETAPFNILTVGASIWELFTNGLFLMFHDVGTDDMSSMEQNAYSIFKWFTMIMNMLLIVEGYMIFANKKYS